MNKYYVNEFKASVVNAVVPYGQCVIGLFKQCNTKGKGNFCGYYSSEYYINTELYAYYIADFSGLYTPERRLSDVTICDPAIKLNEVLIGTHIWTNVIEAETVEEAIQMFADAKWRRWASPFDEVGMIPISNCPKCGRRPTTYMRGYLGVCTTHFECEECGIDISCDGNSDLKAAIMWNNAVSNYQKEEEK